MGAETIIKSTTVGAGREGGEGEGVAATMALALELIPPRRRTSSNPITVGLINVSSEKN